MTSEPAEGVARMGRRRFIQATAALATGAALSVSGSPTRSGSVKASDQTPDQTPDAVLTLPRPQSVTAISGLDPALPGVIRRAQALRACDSGQLLVLSYHQVFADELAPVAIPNPFSVSASQLLSHLTLLRALGFRPVRLAEVLRARSLGRAMPPRSVLLTFDDGTAGQWTHADRVLQRTGFSAVTFLITGYVGAASEFLSWNEVRAMVASGRWEVGDHTHNDHHTVPAGPSMQMQSALINRAWNPATHTLESLPAAEARVRSDLSRSLDVLRQQRLGRPLAFAYPFSRVEGPTNDKVFTEYSEELAARLFPLRFTNFSPGRLATPADLVAGLVPRFEIHRHVDVVQMWEQMYAANMKAVAAGAQTGTSGPLTLG